MCRVVCGRVVCVGLCRWCVLCGSSCVLCGAAWHSEKCVSSERLRVRVQNASVCASKTRACVQHALVFATTHGSVLHTVRREVTCSLLSLVPSLFLPSFFHRSLHSFSFSFSSLPPFSSLTGTKRMITRPVGSLCVHTALTCQSVRVHGPVLIPCRATMFASCTEQLSWHSCASLVPLGLKWAWTCAGNGCLVLFGCVRMCNYVIVCVVFVVLLVAVDALAVVWWWRFFLFWKKTISVLTVKIPWENFSITDLYYFKKIKKPIIYSYYSLNKFEKIDLCTTSNL